MATMVKEKRREKKKSKDKQVTRSNVVCEMSSNQYLSVVEDFTEQKTLEDMTAEILDENKRIPKEINETVPSNIIVKSNDENGTIISKQSVVIDKSNIHVETDNIVTNKVHDGDIIKDDKSAAVNEPKSILDIKLDVGVLNDMEGNFKDLSTKLDRFSIPTQFSAIEQEDRFKEITTKSAAYLTIPNQMENEFRNVETQQNNSLTEQQFSTSMNNLGEIATSSTYLKTTYCQKELLNIPAQKTEDESTKLLETKSYSNIQSLSEEQFHNMTEVQDHIIPSAPMFEQEIPQCIHKREVVIQKIKPNIICMPLEEVIKLFGGKEIAEVKMMSEREEAVVEAGPVSGPEHPLVDLLSTFRSSLTAVERERTQLARGFAAEEKSRSSLWKIEKRSVNLSEPCSCGASVEFRATYEHAELLKEKLPVARLRLEGLLRDVQDSYCHYQHAALLAHCQIEELISETVEGSKPEIREALSLILQALRLSDSAPIALSSALQRWASALCAALVDTRDIRHLLFLIHHLFRQSRSVRWAARHVRLNVDSVSAARVIALLDVLLARPKPQLDAALECTEEIEEVWEEVDKHGSGCAVSEGTLRERDLLALMYAFPLRELVARLVLFTHSDIKQARAHEWVDSSGGRAVVRACCGVRALLATLRRAARVHAQYARLRRALRALAARALLALSCLHLCSRERYSEELKAKLTAELEAAFADGLTLFETHELHELPATLLAEDTARDYCISNMLALHDKTPKLLASLSVEMPVLPCELRVRIVAQAAIHRAEDHELARIVMEFLFQTGIKRKSVQCKGCCDIAARDWLARLLAAHAYLYAVALHTFADLNQMEALDQSSVKALSLHLWRPNCDEVRSVLDDWSQRCTLLLQHLLLQLDYTPYTGLSLETQLTIGSWLSNWTRSSTAPASEWSWQVLRGMRLHRTCWSMPIDAPPPDDEPVDLFSIAYALLSSSWGHCIPLICSEGVSALCTLAAARPRDAVHCLSPIMVVMSHSPESVSLTPKFTEMFTILLSSGPSLMQRALGRGGVSGSELLLRVILEQLEREQCAGVPRSSILSVWMHALWRCTLPVSASAILDTAALACREWPQLDSHANNLLQEENAKEHISHSIRNASSAPLLCECVLRASHALCMRTRVHAQLLQALNTQRVRSQRIHVDNALQQIGASMGSEELVIYRCATVAAAAPLHHPSHLTLWRLFLHLYLQRPPDISQDSGPPVGPLFFSGIIKSRALSHIKKRLQDTATYHHGEAETLKTEKITTIEGTSISNIDKSKTTDDSLLPALSIADLIGESSGSSDSESDLTEEETDGNLNKDERTRMEDSEEITEKNNLNLLRYHLGAEKMIREYLRWLEEGEKVRAAPHHADIARFIPEQALEAGWQNALSRSRPPPCSELESPLIPPTLSQSANSSPPPSTPFHTAVNSIMEIRDRSSKRSGRTKIKSPVEDVNFKDSRMLLALVDKHLKDIERLAHEWYSEVCRVSSLDSRLWELVCALRVRKSLPAVKKQCPNKCKPLTIAIPAEEWCVSTGADRGIKENRCSARAAIRRLARPRPHAARTAAALQTIARRIRSSEAAARVLERAWRCAGACAQCSAAHTALMALTTDLAERWICSDGRLCAELLSRWSRHSKTPVQQAQCTALVSPRTNAWPLVYTALLTATLPDHTLFSCLSKFEMSRCSETLDQTQRRVLLEALLTAARRWGHTPDPQHHMLLELIGVHTRALIIARELCAHVTRCTRASVVGALPPQHWTHVARAAEDYAAAVPFDQLGHLLRELGVMWWEVRTGVTGVRTSVKYAAYAPHVARVLRTLQRAFVAAGVQLSYAPERVALYAWSALQESWGAWISPHPAAPPLLPSTADEESYTPMLKHFIDNIHQIMLDCPGSEIPLLQKVFEWSVQSYASAQGGAQESRVQASALLAALRALPWPHHQWCRGDSLHVALQICTISDKELTSWCCHVWRNTTAETWARDSDATETCDRLAPRLASLLYLFTGTALPHEEQTLEEATRLPWWRLPEPALDEALDRFFVVHHNPAQAYHDLPQFRVLLHASGLAIHRDVAPQHQYGGDARHKRARCVSQWVRGASAPALLAHAPAHAAAVLDNLTRLAPYLECSEGEIEVLLSRAVVMMCIEPMAAAALPVWERWVACASARMVRACVSAAGALTALEYFAPLADAAVKAHLNHTESTGWPEIVSRWASCPWQDACPLAARHRLHAAYACALAHAHAHGAARTTLHTLLAADINFVENEAIVAVWICYLCRIGRECGGQRGGEGAECVGAAAALAARWAEPPRASILRLVTMQQDSRRPTAQHRLLCRLAQCILTPSEAAARAYEVACAAALGSHPGDVTAWGRAPHPKRLPWLAVRLYPQHERYFASELDMAPDDSG